MSIQPNRVIHRIIDQVDRSDWPPLASRVFSSLGGGEIIRFYSVPNHERYATPLHFWVHALREELQATDHREDLVSAACHALGQNQSLADWLKELSEFSLEDGRTATQALGLSEATLARDSLQVYRMLDSVCRRSSVVSGSDRLMAHFWGHGSSASWRRVTRC